MVLKLIIESMFKLQKVLSQISLNSKLHAYFEDFVCISRPKSLHESCSTISMVNFGTSFSLIG